jgi:hypothetical protein
MNRRTASADFRSLIHGTIPVHSISATKVLNIMAATLLQQNPYLRDPTKRRAALRVSAASSSAVEGIRKPFADSNPLTAPAPSRKRAKSAAQRG